MIYIEKKNSIVWVMFYHNMQNMVKLFFNVEMVYIPKYSPKKPIQCDCVRGVIVTYFYPLLFTCLVVKISFDLEFVFG